MAHQGSAPDWDEEARRVARVQTKAKQVFGDPEKADRWLRQPKRAFGGSVPLDLARSAAGAQMVEELLLQIEYGMYR